MPLTRSAGKPTTTPTAAERPAAQARAIGNGKPAAGLQDPEHLLKARLGTGQVADAETHHGRIEAGVRAGEALGVPLDIPDAGGQGGAGHLGPARRHHGPVDVIDDHAPGAAHGPGGPEGQVGGAAAHIQEAHPRL